MRIVVDAMGGDNAPAAIVQGAVDAANELKVNIALVGIEDQIKKELARFEFPASSIEIIHAPEVVGMHEPATVSIRKKKNSSISQGVELLKKDGYDAFVSAGNTGAVVAASTILLRMLEGVERPAIGTVIPTLNNFALLMDAGANPEAKPIHLLQSGIMARVYAREVLGVENPSIGLLNIGAEASKGSGFEKETYKLMEENLGGFNGNVEADEVYKGTCDCVICDGFVGNVVLKVSEGLMESVGALIKREIKKYPLAVLGAFLMKSSLKHIKKLTDYSEYGGAPLLGVDGIVMISHGRSSPKAIKNAIKAAMREVEHDILGLLAKEIAYENNVTSG